MDAEWVAAIALIMSSLISSGAAVAVALINSRRIDNRIEEVIEEENEDEEE